jgi:hypothetical protein
VEEDPPRLTAAVVRDLLEKLAPVKGELVLVGGQALSLWAERYEDTLELRESGPHTSRDIDFFGRADQVRRCAALLGGTHQVYGRDRRTPAAGVITTAEGFHVDILHTLAGVTPLQLVDQAVEFASVRVMHPIHVMASRVANVSDLQRHDDHALRQLRASVYVVREHVREVLCSGDVDEATDMNEAAFEVVVGLDSVDAWRTHHIDLFDAILVDPRLGSAFDQRYEQMREQWLQTQAAPQDQSDDDDDG